MKNRIHNRMKKNGIGILLAFLQVLLLWLPVREVSADGFRYEPDNDGELVIVIDPGHGGENLGADYNGYLEKEMNIIVANAMAEELSRYEDVTVYLTHTDAEDNLSIRDRAAFAASVHADFVFCLHFNMSVDNKLFGSEVWISAFGEENRQGYLFGQIQMRTMQEMGLYLRGVKTKLNDSGTDYYGILRYCEEYGIPAALIEHCHIDHETDVPFCDSLEDLIAFGKADATSAAKFFGLSSVSLGISYADYPLWDINPNKLYARADTTDPDFCMIEDTTTANVPGELQITVTATDYDSPMLYYSYSIDGGNTYTPYLEWPGSDMLNGTSEDTFSFIVEIPSGVSPAIRVRAFNQYDRFLESNLLDGYPVYVEEPEEILSETESEESNEAASSETENGTTQPTPAAGFHAPAKTETEKEKDGRLFALLIIALIAAAILCVALLISNIIMARKRSRKKNGRP